MAWDEAPTKGSKFTRRVQAPATYERTSGMVFLESSYYNRYRTTNDGDGMYVTQLIVNEMDNVGAKVPSTVGFRSHGRLCPAQSPRHIHRRFVSTPSAAPRSSPSRLTRRTPLPPTRNQDRRR